MVGSVEQLASSAAVGAKALFPVIEETERWAARASAEMTQALASLLRPDEADQAEPFTAEVRSFFQLLQDACKVNNREMRARERLELTRSFRALGPVAASLLRAMELLDLTETVKPGILLRDAFSDPGLVETGRTVWMTLPEAPWSLLAPCRAVPMLMGTLIAPETAEGHFVACETQTNHLTFSLQSGRDAKGRAVGIPAYIQVESGWLGLCAARMGIAVVGTTIVAPASPISDSEESPALPEIAG
jgi:hypothetical protein